MPSDRQRIALTSQSAGRDRRTGRSRSQRASTLRRLFFTWSLVLIGLAAVSFQTAVPAEVLLLDASVVGGGRWYAGLVTSLTVMGWTVATVALGFAALASRVSGRLNAARATGWMALILAVLLFDDLFLLHTSLVPSLLGGTKWALVFAEALAVLVWILRWRSEIVRTRWELLVAATLGFGCSLGFDRFPIGDDRWALIAEDGAKALGVVAIATWAVSTAVDLIVSIAESARPTRMPTGDGGSPQVADASHANAVSTDG